MIRKLLLSVFVLFSVGLFAQTNLSGFYPSVDASGLRFGTETAIHDNTIVVASESSNSPSTIGKVYVFSQENQTITLVNSFYPDDAESSDQFGKSISLNEVILKLFTKRSIVVVSTAIPPSMRLTSNSYPKADVTGVAKIVD